MKPAMLILAVLLGSCSKHAPADLEPALPTPGHVGTPLAPWPYRDEIVYYQGPLVQARLAQAIARMEGWRNPESLSHRLRNPLMLVYAGQKNGTLGMGCNPAGIKDEYAYCHGVPYAAFPTDADGWAAGAADIGMKWKRVEASCDPDTPAGHFQQPFMVSGYSFFGSGVVPVGLTPPVLPRWKKLKWGRDCGDDLYTAGLVAAQWPIEGKPEYADKIVAMLQREGVK